jgi:presenilin-like A22 family membrane protease
MPSTCTHFTTRVDINIKYNNNNNNSLFLLVHITKLISETTTTATTKKKMKKFNSNLLEIFIYSIILFFFCVFQYFQKYCFLINKINFILAYSIIITTYLCLLSIYLSIYMCVRVSCFVSLFKI